MKNKITSFLFFLILGFLFGSPHLLSQEKKDSLTYYGDIAQNPKSFEDLVKANQYFRNNLALAKKGDSRILFYKYFIASIEIKLGNYSESEENLVFILKNIELLKDIEYRIKYQKSVFNLLGNI